LEEEDEEEKGGTLKGGGWRRRGNGSAEGRPQLSMGSEKTPGAGNRGYPVLGRGSGLPHRCWARVLRVSPGWAQLSAALCPPSGGRRKLLYYLNDGHYGTFRIFPRESEPRMPIMVKVRRRFHGSGTS